MINTAYIDSNIPRESTQAKCSIYYSLQNKVHSPTEFAASLGNEIEKQLMEKSVREDLELFNLFINLHIVFLARYYREFPGSKWTNLFDTIKYIL